MAADQGVVQCLGGRTSAADEVGGSETDGVGPSPAQRDRPVRWIDVDDHPVQQPAPDRHRRDAEAVALHEQRHGDVGGLGAPIARGRPDQGKQVAGIHDQGRARQPRLITGRRADAHAQVVDRRRDPGDHIAGRRTIVHLFGSPRPPVPGRPGYGPPSQLSPPAGSATAGTRARAGKRTGSERRPNTTAIVAHMSARPAIDSRRKCQTTVVYALGTNLVVFTATGAPTRSSAFTPSTASGRPGWSGSRRAGSSTSRAVASMAANTSGGALSATCSAGVASLSGGAIRSGLGG